MALSSGRSRPIAAKRRPDIGKDNQTRNPHAAATTASTQFKFASLAALNRETLKWTCKARCKEALHKHRLRHAQVCRKVPPTKSAEQQEKQYPSRGSCFYCHADDHWAAKRPVKEKRLYL